ncbi:eukaryotic porin/Tom40 [Cytidiella melzeri]|nr:eukaryotic porin/Tom40 [Cytidiella melzeri]
MSLPQPVPPSWKDLGKSSTDLLQKDYPFGAVNIEVKTSTPSNVAFKVTGKQNEKTKVIDGDIEAKYSSKPHGIVLTQAWTTSNLVRTTLEAENHLAKGLKFDLATTLAGNGSAKTAALTSVYKQPGLHTRAVLDLFKGPTLTADTVVGRDGFLLGAEAAYNVTEGKVTRYAAAAGFSAPEYAVTLQALNNLNTFTASYYHRVSTDVEAGAKAVYDTKATTQGVHLEVGVKSYLDSAAFVKAKINNIGVLGLGYTQALRPGVRASFGLALDTNRLNEAVPSGPAHKFGASITFEG